MRADAAGEPVTTGSVTADQSDPTPANNSDSETTTVTALQPIARVWTGAVDTDWANDGNWSPAGAPQLIDDVGIPAAAARQPTLGSSTRIRTLAVAAGATLTLSGSGTTLTLDGNLDAGTTIVGGTVVLAGTGTVTGAMNANVDVTGTYTANGTVTITDTLDVAGTFTVGGATVNVDVFSTVGTGVLVMANAAGGLNVRNGSFDGGPSTLTAGTLRVSGNLSAGTTAMSYAAVASHILVLNGTGNQTVSFQSAESQIGQLTVSKTGGTISLGSDVRLVGALVSAATSVTTFAGANRLLSAFGGLDVDGAIFDNVRLQAQFGVIVRFDNVTFRNMTAIETQLLVSHVGAATAFTFTNVRFLTTPTAPGLYIRAGDTAPGDGLVFTIILLNAQPVNGSAFTQTLNGAIVNWGDMSLRLATPLLGINRSMQATVTLAQAAGAGGRVVSLASSDTAVATVTPANIAVPEGGTVADFTVNGIAAGTATMTATSAGLQSTTAQLTVTAESLISLGTGLVIAPGQSSGLALSIGVPAPAGGLRIALTSSDPAVATVTPEIVIAEGLQIPSSNPVVSGLTTGVVQISATATGFAPDTVSASVTLTLSFSPATFSVVDDTTRDITLHLSAPAPPGGLTLNTSTDNTNIATVPQTVTVPAGFLSIGVPVTGVAVGSTTVRASGTGIGEATATVNVTAPPNLSISNESLGRDLQSQRTVSLGAPAPIAGVQITLTSSDPERLLLSTSATTVGTASIVLTVAANQSSSPAYFVQALQDNGAPTYTATATGYGADTATVTLGPSGFTIDFPGNFSINTGAANRTIQIVPATLHPTSLAWQANGMLRAGANASVAVTSSNTATGTITTSPLAFTGGTASRTTEFDPVGEGTATITVEPVTGFSTSTTFRQIVATVSAPAITLGDFTIGQNLQVTANASLGQAAPAGGVVVTITSLSAQLLLSTNPAAEGTASIQATVNAGLSAVPTFYIQALGAVDTGQIRTTASGYATDTSTVTMVPSGFIVDFPGNFSTDAFALNRSIGIASARLTPGTLAWAQNQPVRGGFSVDVDVTSSQPAVGTITVSPLEFANGDGSQTTAFDPIGDGVTTIAVGTPTGFSTPSTFRTISATVTASNILMGDATVGRDLQQTLTVNLESTPPSPVDIVLTVNDPPHATLSLDPLVAGTGSITLTNVGNTSARTIYVQGRSLGTTTVTAEAIGFADDTSTIAVHPSGFIVDFPGNFTTDTFAANRSIGVAPARLNPTTLNWAQNQPVRGGLTVSVDVTSSDTNVGPITSSPLSFGPNIGSRTTAFDPRASGTTELAVSVPPGFDAPTTFRSIVATVTAPNINASDVTVGRDLQSALSISLDTAPPSPVTVTVRSNAIGLATVSSSPMQDGGETVTFSNVTSTNVGTVYVQGRAIGSTALTIQAPGYNDRLPVVTVDPSGFIVDFPGDFTTNTFAANRSIGIAPARLNPTTLNWAQNQPLRGGLSVTVSLTNSTPAVGVLTASSLTFTAGLTSLTTAFDPLAQGETTIAVTAPAGFSTPTNFREITATVTAPAITFSDVTVGEDLQVQRTISLQDAPPSPVTVTVTVLAPQTATLTSDATIAGVQTLEFANVTTTNVGTVWVQGRQLGTTTINAMATGYNSETASVEVRPSGFIIDFPGDFAITVGAADRLIQIAPAMLDPVTLNWQANQSLRGGLSVDVTVQSSNPAIGTITVSPLSFALGAASRQTAFHAVGAGTSTISVVTPAGFEVPSNFRQIMATVNPP
jgi:hypothetical protein